MSPEIQCFFSTAQKPRRKLLEWNKLDKYFIVGKNFWGFPKNLWWQSGWALALVWGRCLTLLFVLLNTGSSCSSLSLLDGLHWSHTHLLNQFSFWLNTSCKCVFECSWLWHVNWLERVWKRTVTQRLIRKATSPHVDDHSLTWLPEGQINLTLLCGVGTTYWQPKQVKLLCWFGLGFFFFKAQRY